MLVQQPILEIIYFRKPIELNMSKEETFHIYFYFSCYFHSFLYLQEQFILFCLIIIIQMNYHYRPPGKNDDKIRELSQLDGDLDLKKKQLEKLRLEQEFYEDNQKPTKDKMSLADQIMNELISGPSPPPPPNYYLPPPPASNYQPPPPTNNYQPPPPANNYNPPPLNYVQPPRPMITPAANPRQNNLINERELQKIKMQNQKHEGLFPSEQQRVRSYGKQPPITEQEHHQPFVSPPPPIVKPKSPEPNPNFNPFVRADQLQKLKREQNHKQYLKELQLQRQEQEKIKEQREREKKMMKGQHYDFLSAAKNEPEKPIVKKTDPNSRPPKVEQMMGNYSQFDSTLIKSKAIEIKSKYKKGKITFEECEREIKNLKKQYLGDFDALLNENTSDNREKEPVSEQPVEKLKLYKEESPKKEYFQDERKDNMGSFPIKNQSINYSQFMPSMLPQQEPQRAHLFSSLPPAAPYMPMSSQPLMASLGAAPQSVPPEYMELMRKMFEVCVKEVKEAYSQRIDQQDKAYQQTLNKFLQHSQNNFLTQQLPVPPNQQQKQFFSDAKQPREAVLGRESPFDSKESNIKRKNPPESLVNIPFGESDNSEYYDKSLSGIASKIPYMNPSSSKPRAKNEKEQKVLKQSGIQQFYNRKYKVKPLQKFTFLGDPGEQQQIPSTSQYLRTANALQELEMRFHEDLAELKRLQTQKSNNEILGKMTRNTSYSYERRVLKDPSMIQVGNVNPSVQAQQNPFLKKHVSNDDNMMTFNQHELRMGSPINSYSPKSKKEILEQDEYQTEPRVREESKVPAYMQEYEQRLKMPTKALDFIKMNNQVLNKYGEETAEKQSGTKVEMIMIRDESEVKQKESNYFSNNDISPVKNSENYYEESLETIRSHFESAHHSKRPKIDPPPNELAPPSKQYEHGLSPAQMAGYSQTVESIEESSVKNSRPPVAKRRNLSKKKESSIARSKINPDSSLSKAFGESLERSEVPKFDSNVYESQYEESMNFQRQHKTADPYPHIQPNIEIYAPTIVAPRSAMEIEGNPSSYEPKVSSAKAIQPQGKLKSLEEARKLAREYRVKVDESKEYKSVEERFSELESFMTKRGDESSVHSIRKETRVEARESKKETGGKRDIMKMLEELQDEDEYQQDFESYREESEQYQ